MEVLPEGTRAERSSLDGRTDRSGVLSAPRPAPTRARVEPSRTRTKPRLKRRPTGTFGVAVIGASTWGRRILRKLVRNPRTRVLQVADSDFGRLEEARTRYPELTYSSDVKAAIEHPDVNIVVLAGSVESHSQVLRLALESRKHVLVRRLVATTPEAARDAVRLAEKHGCALAVANELVFEEAIQRARRSVDSGTFGDVRSVNATLFHPELREDTIFQEILPREIAALDALLDSRAVEVSVTRASTGVNGNGNGNGSGNGNGNGNGALHGVTANLRYQNGTSVNLALHESPIKARWLAIVGTEATGFVDALDSRSTFQIRTARDAATSNGVRVDLPRSGSSRLIEHFIECLDSDLDSPVNGSKAVVGLPSTIRALRDSLDAQSLVTLEAPSVLAPTREARGAPVAPEAPAKRRPTIFPGRARGERPVYRVDAYPEMVGLIREAWKRNEGVWIASKRLEWLAKRLDLKERTADGLPKVWFGPSRKGLLDRILSRSLDVAFSLAALTICAPIWTLIAALVKLDRGPVFYVAKRVGRGGMPFKFAKFRSMRPDNDDTKHRRFMSSVINGGKTKYRDANGNPILKDPKDSRVTAIGRILRKTGLDEFPQFLHVLTDHMSVVGPRPPIPYEVECYHEWMEARLDGRVGITGLWQVNGRNEVSFEEQVMLDIYYVANRSFLMDLRIIARTPGVMIRGQGAY